MADKLDCALDLMRRLPPADVEDNLAGLIGTNVVHVAEHRALRKEKVTRFAHT
jgi:hypothetical protein